jgi:hypothetical protein
MIGEVVTVIRTRVVAASAAVAALLAAAGCSSSKHTDALPPTSAAPATSASASPSDPAAADKAAVLDVYSKFWAEQVKAYAQGQVTGTDLNKYAANLALSSARAGVNNDTQAGFVLKGAPKNDAKVDAIDVTASPKKATLTDCLDVSGWTPVDIKTGAAKPVTNKNLKYVVTATALLEGSAWMITEINSDMSRPC